MSYLIGIDIGGTFTDFLLVDETSGHQFAHKSPSTPSDPSRAFLRGLSDLEGQLGLGQGELLPRTRMIVHGTTVATNAVLTDRGARAGLITTEGFRDVLQMRRGVRSRDHLYDNKHVAPPPLVRRAHRVGVAERIDVDGTVLTTLDEDAVRTATRRLLNDGVEAIAVCFMHSYADPRHEQRAVEIARELTDDCFISASYEVLPQIRLYERVSTTVMNAYVGPVVKRYIGRLTDRLAEGGFAGVLLVMQSNGGIAAPGVIEQLPASTVLSGPAAGPVAALRSARHLGVADCILVEMGGTSFDASLVKSGEVQITREGQVNSQALSLPMTEIHTIGAGGGSIAWVDDGGLLQVGPRSAGAEPGPAAYDGGGTEPTVTDANVVLGYIDPDCFLGGTMSLRGDLAEQAVAGHIADPLGISTLEAAAGIVEVVTLKMAAGTKDISVRRGVDPRELPLIVGGGAGPLHGAEIARELGIETIVVPRRSAVLCASGMLLADLRHDYARGFRRQWAPEEGPAAAALLRDALDQGRATLRDEGIAESDIRTTVTLDLRYVGQHHEVSVDVPLSVLENPGDGRDPVAQALHDRHRQLYGFANETADIEVLTARATVHGGRGSLLDDRAPLPLQSGVAGKGSRPAWSTTEGALVDFDVYDGALLAAGEQCHGPAIIETAATTILVPDGYCLRVDPSGDFVIAPEEGQR